MHDPGEAPKATGRPRPRARLWLAAGVLSFGVLAAGCGASDAAHVIGTSVPSSTPSSPATTVPATAPSSSATSAPTNPSATTTPTTGSGATPISPAELSQIDSQLQQLSASLQQASGDLNRAQAGG